MQNISNDPNKTYSNFILMGMFMIIAAMHIPIVFFVGKEAILIIIDEIMRESSTKAHLSGEKETLTGGKTTKTASGNIENAIRKSVGAQDGALFGEDDETATLHYSNMPNWIYYVVSLSIYTLVVIAAVTLGDIGIVFGIIGSTAVSFIIFLGPAGFFLKGASIEGVEIGSLEKGFAIFWCFLGALVMVAGNFFVVYGSIKS